MSRCVVIGHSIYAVKALEQLRSEFPEMELVICAQEPGLPYDRNRFVEVLAKRIERHEIYYRSEDFYRNLRIQFVTDQKVGRIHFKRKYITFEDNTKLDFDRLIIANWEKDDWPELKGLTKRGVFSLRTIEQLDEFLKMSSQLDTVAVQTNTLRGVRIAQALALRTKDVVLSVSGDRLLSGVISEEASRWLDQLLRQMGIRILYQCSVTEVLGENDVRAVRLAIGKVIGCEAVVFADVGPDCRFFERFDLRCDPFISVNEMMQASETDVFALDQMVRPSGHPSEFSGEDEALLNWQVRALMAGFLKRDGEGPVSVCDALFDIGSHHISIWGRGRSSENGFEYRRMISENAGCILALDENMMVDSVMTVDVDDRKAVLPVDDFSISLSEQALAEYSQVFRQDSPAVETPVEDVPADLNSKEELSKQDVF
ncbi:MAG TPA: FAD-dependent oxidoreductase [Candidatus Omnitrophota bacterium]|nr:FAD-dependent oxidoreductase [Candidatus Omnitrophota bacterium]HSA30925.1 FAD-dependent oxidoreductase [Candidatus Omnitrophota bacterium]